MNKLKIGYGSEWHLLQYLGRHRKELDSWVLQKTGAEYVDWLDFPIHHGEKQFEKEWCGLDFLKKSVGVPEKWKSFWPQGGNQQNWDAVAQLRYGSKIEWLLVEAKAHRLELKSNCKAKNNGGLSQIQSAFTPTKAGLNSSEKCDWLKPYYQFCNRLAVLYFLNNIQIPARLLYIYFLGDQNPNMTPAPKNQQGWTSALKAMHEHSGLKGQNPLASRIHELFIQVRATGGIHQDD